MQQVFYLGAFIENVAGTVTNPENAVGAPGASFTANTQNSWTAKWQLDTTGTSSFLTPYSWHKIALHVRRAAATSGVDPAIWRVRVKNADGRDILDFRQCGQINERLGAVDLINGSWDLLDNVSFRGAVRDAEKRWANRSGGSTAFHRLTWTFMWILSPSTIVLGATTAHNSSVVARIEKDVNNEYSCFAVNTTGNEQGYTGNPYEACSPDGNFVAIGKLNGGDLYHTAEVEIEPGVWQWQYVRTAFNSLPNSSTQCRGVVFSPASNYLLIVGADGSDKARLFRCDSSAVPVYERVTVPDFAGGGSTQGSAGCDWKGTRMVVCTRQGWIAYNWTEGTETVSPITETTGLQFGNHYDSSASLTDDGRWLAALHMGNRNTIRPTIYVQDLDTPSDLRTLELTGHHTARYVKWLNSEYIALLALPDEAVTDIQQYSTQYALGVLTIVKAPTAGPLELVSTWSTLRPLSMAPMRFFDVDANGISGSWFNDETYTDNPDSLSALIHSTFPDPIETTHVLELEGPFGNSELAARVGVLGGYPTIYSGPNWSRRADGGGIGKPRASYDGGGGQKSGVLGIDPTGRLYVVRINNIIRVYDIRGIDWEKDGFPATPLYTSPTFSTLISGFSDSLDNLSWASDGSAFFVGVRECYRVDTDVNEAIAIHRFTEAFQSSLGYDAVFRRKLSGDSTPETMVAFGSNGANFVWQIIDGELVDKSLDIVFPSRPTTTVARPVWSWSKDGEYVVFTGGSQVRLYKWNAGAPINLPISFTFPPISSVYNRCEWSDYDPNVFFLEAVRNVAPQTNWALFEVSGETVTELADSGTRTLFNEFNIPCFIRWIEKGKFIGHSTHYSNTSTLSSWYAWDIETAPQLGLFVYEWDRNKLATGLTPVPDIYKGKRAIHAWTDAPIMGTNPKPYDFGTSSVGKLYSISQSDIPSWFRYGVDTSELDYKSISVGEGWTVEIETIGDTSNSVQLAGVELTLDLELFLLPPPSNLQSISTGGNRALVSWDWTA